MNNKIKICYLREDSSGVAYHRIEIPFNNLNENYKDLDIKGCNSFTNDFPPEQFDVIVLNRVSRSPVDYILRAKEAGVKIILDLDDWIELPKWHGSHHGIDTPQIEEMIKRNIEIADVIWCASDYLMKCVFNFMGKNIDKYCFNHILIIPNAIDFTQPQFIPQPQPKDRYTIGYIAGANHHLDVELLDKSFKKLLIQYKYDNIEVPRTDYNLLVGGYSEELQSKTYWDYVTEIFTSEGKLNISRFIKVKAQNCYNYAVMYNLIDLALAPLSNDIFSKCKSNLKVLEAAAFSLPIICSNEEPYKEFIKLGLVYSSEGNWDGRIKDLIKNPKKGINMGKALHEYCREHYDINVVNKLRYQSIKNLINK